MAAYTIPVGAELLCSGPQEHVVYTVGAPMVPGADLPAASFVRADGTTPVVGSPFIPTCAVCGAPWVVMGATGLIFCNVRTFTRN